MRLGPLTDHSWTPNMLHSPQSLLKQHAAPEGEVGHVSKGAPATPSPLSFSQASLLGLKIL